MRKGVIGESFNAYDKDGNKVNDIDDPNVLGICCIKKFRDKANYDRKLWNELIKVGRELEKDLCHELPLPFVKSIIGTLEYYGASKDQIQQCYIDLVQAKYKIWDWLGMIYTGALWAEGITFTCIENMVKLYIEQKDVGGFGWWLRGHDLDCEEPKRCTDCIQSYKNWKEEILSKGNDPNNYS